jgi:thiopurine S-methyltransferase
MSEPWKERWQEGRIGWHQPDGNASLRKHWREAGRRVLVPLCGKTSDLKWLADKGNDVVGVELSDLAIKAFFDEQGLDYDVLDGELPAYQARESSITIFCGDYFELKSVRCNAHYDRGALIAMPADKRAAYAAHTNTLLEEAAEQFVITLEYDQTVADGPPFSVSPVELLTYWPDLVRFDSYDDIENGPPKFRDAGLTEMVEVIWRSPRSQVGKDDAE